jgi:hypothetical protein
VTAVSHYIFGNYSGDADFTQSVTPTLVLNRGLSGTLYVDLDDSGTLDAGDPGLAGRQLFLDLKKDGKFDPGDPLTVTDASGNFSFAGFAPGTASVIEVPNQGDSNHYSVKQEKLDANGNVDIGVMVISPIAPIMSIPTSVAPGSVSAEDSGSAYIRSLYETILGRAGSASEVAAWAGSLGAGMTRPQIAEAFVNSFEHRSDEVDTYYQEFLHRAADAGSIVWTDELMAGVSEANVVQGILDSPEYQSAHLTPYLFVSDLYIDVLGRQGSASEIAAWQSALASGMSRQALVASIVGSTEAVDQVVESDYAAYLHRQPDANDLSTWTSIIDAPGGSASDVTVDILASDEFYQDAQKGTQS